MWLVDWAAWSAWGLLRLAWLTIQAALPHVLVLLGVLLLVVVSFTGIGAAKHYIQHELADQLGLRDALEADAVAWPAPGGFGEGGASGAGGGLRSSTYGGTAWGAFPRSTSGGLAAGGGGARDAHGRPKSSRPLLSSTEAALQQGAAVVDALRAGFTEVAKELAVEPPDLRGLTGSMSPGASGSNGSTSVRRGVCCRRAAPASDAAGTTNAVVAKPSRCSQVCSTKLQGGFCGVRGVASIAAALLALLAVGPPLATLVVLPRTAALARGAGYSCSGVTVLQLEDTALLPCASLTQALLPPQGLALLPYWRAAVACTSPGAALRQIAAATQHAWAAGCSAAEAPQQVAAGEAPRASEAAPAGAASNATAAAAATSSSPSPDATAASTVAATIGNSRKDTASNASGESRSVAAAADAAAPSPPQATAGGWLMRLWRGKKEAAAPAPAPLSDNATLTEEPLVVNNTEATEEAVQAGSDASARAASPLSFVEALKAWLASWWGSFTATSDATGFVTIVPTPGGAAASALSTGKEGAGSPSPTPLAPPPAVTLVARARAAASAGLSKLKTRAAAHPLESALLSAIVAGWLLAAVGRRVAAAGASARCAAACRRLLKGHVAATTTPAASTPAPPTPSPTSSTSASARASTDAEVAAEVLAWMKAHWAHERTKRAGTAPASLVDLAWVTDPGVAGPWTHPLDWATSMLGVCEALREAPSPALAALLQQATGRGVAGAGNNSSSGSGGARPLTTRFTGEPLSAAASSAPAASPAAPPAPSPGVTLADPAATATSQPGALSPATSVGSSRTTATAATAASRSGIGSSSGLALRSSVLARVAARAKLDASSPELRHAAALMRLSLPGEGSGLIPLASSGVVDDPTLSSYAGLSDAGSSPSASPGGEPVRSGNPPRRQLARYAAAEEA